MAHRRIGIPERQTAIAAYHTPARRGLLARVLVIDSKIVPSKVSIVIENPRGRTCDGQPLCACSTANRARRWPLWPGLACLQL